MGFFFKHKTAYEVRISDWSSDVCSSDLIAEIAGVEGFEALLVLRVKLAAAAVCVAFGLARVDIGGGEPLVLPLIDQPGELAGGEALFVEIGGGDELLQQAKLIVGVEAREDRKSTRLNSSH